MNKVNIPRKPNKLLLGAGYYFYLKKFVNSKLSLKINNNIRDMEPPYILLINHTSVQDFKISTAAMYPKTMNYICGYNQLIGKSRVMLKLGTIAKRQFTPDINVIKQIKNVLNNNGILALFPEGKISIDGRCNQISQSVAKLIKILKVPVAVMNIKGSFIDKPKFDSTSRRNCPCIADINRLFSIDDVSSLPVEEMHSKIIEALNYDEYKYQLDNKISIDYKDQCSGLHTLLYQCPHCNKQMQMKSTGSTIYCNNCGISYCMNEYGQLNCINGQSVFTSIASWNDWQRANVKNELISGTYKYEDSAILEHLYDYKKGYVAGGKGKFVYSNNLFKYVGTDKDNKEYILNYSTVNQYTLSFDNGKCFYLHTQDDSMRFTPSNPIEIGKFNLVLEEAFKLKNQI